jgi:hypothetical protein
VSKINNVDAFPIFFVPEYFLEKAKAESKINAGVRFATDNKPEVRDPGYLLEGHWTVSSLCLHLKSFRMHPIPHNLDLSSASGQWEDSQPASEALPFAGCPRACLVQQGT